MVPPDSLTLKTEIIDTKIVVPSALVQQFWSKISFCKMVAKVTHLRASHIPFTEIFFLIYAKVMT